MLGGSHVAEKLLGAFGFEVIRSFLVLTLKSLQISENEGKITIHRYLWEWKVNVLIQLNTTFFAITDDHFHNLGPRTCLRRGCCPDLLVCCWEDFGVKSGIRSSYFRPARGGVHQAWYLMIFVRNKTIRFTLIRERMETFPKSPYIYIPIQSILLSAWFETCFRTRNFNISWKYMVWYRGGSRLFIWRQDIRRRNLTRKCMIQSDFPNYTCHLRIKTTDKRTDARTKYGIDSTTNETTQKRRKLWKKINGRNGICQSKWKIGLTFIHACLCKEVRNWLVHKKRFSSDTNSYS